MNRYYSDSKPFRWLRKKIEFDKPDGETFEGWDEWDDKMKTTRPVAFWFCETLPDILEKPAEYLIDPISNARYYLYNRYISKTHYLKTGLKPGQYHELDTRILYGCFNELVDFVEIEKAHMQVWCGSDEDKTKYNEPWWHKFRIFRLKSWRNVQAGLDYLAWEISLKDEVEYGGSGGPSSQAIAAQETLDLYYWWTLTRAARGDEWTASGLQAFDQQMDAKYPNVKGFWRKEKNYTSEEKKQYHQLLDKMNQLDQEWNDEDDAMLARLMKLRRCLWT